MAKHPEPSYALRMDADHTICAGGRVTQWSQRTVSPIHHARTDEQAVAFLDWCVHTLGIKHAAWQITALDAFSVTYEYQGAVAGGWTVIVATYRLVRLTGGEYTWQRWTPRMETAYQVALAAERAAQLPRYIY